MSRLSEDLAALQAMLAAKMAPASIAKTLGRSLTWVENQARLIEARELAPIACDLAAAMRRMLRSPRQAAPARRPLAPSPSSSPAPEPAPQLRGLGGKSAIAVKPDAGAGIVEAAFYLWRGGFGTAVRMGDVLLFVGTGEACLDLGSRIDPVRAEDVWRWEAPAKKAT